MFTGDRSGDWLYRALHKFGFASQPDSSSRDDGMKLTDCYITAGVRCAPPDNKPTPEERMCCRPFLLEELQLLGGISVVVALGKIAADTAFDAFRELGRTPLAARPPFGHGIETVLSDRATMLTSFHPSQQNTFTGKLTEPMFDRIFRRARTLLTTEKKHGIQR
jgi:uracil-DNA glycosylase family 4